MRSQPEFLHEDTDDPSSEVAAVFSLGLILARAYIYIHIIERKKSFPTSEIRSTRFDAPFRTVVGNSKNRGAPPSTQRRKCEVFWTIWYYIIMKLALTVPQRVKIPLPLASFRPARSCAAREFFGKVFSDLEMPCSSISPDVQKMVEAMKVWEVMDNHVS